MNQQITKWYQGLAAPLPRLAQEPVFPAIVLSDDELERLACGPRYTKAYSWDCVGHSLFQARSPATTSLQKENRLRLFRALFSQSSWGREESKRCLVGRLVVLNKEHPKITELGRFRPIRICSNVCKLLESWLFRPLSTWANNNLGLQLGFRAGVGSVLAPSTPGTWCSGLWCGGRPRLL